ncbi:elongator complex protein 2-like [Saccostrea echinata]|uniref:elongator complex protein 2-like n=1 Tax=Saccostrea echinata TaxID=191078 RepID=UPI002A7FBDC5|nr:elongator complex protein 2-like [Saccostrea echinata]
MVDIEPIYISCGCNRTPQCVDWSSSGNVCYGACHAVVIYHPEGYAEGHGTISHTLVKHTGRVNCVKWIRNTNAFASDKCFVSGSVDKTAIVWKKCGVDQYDPVAVLDFHSGPITTVNGIEITNQNVTYIVTGATDSQLMIWKDSGTNDFTPLQCLSFGTGFVLDVSLVCLPSTGIPLLACGCDDHKIHLYSLQDDCKLFQLFNKVISLQGHEDWVRAVDFCIEDNGDVMLASAGQDYLIRIWRLSRRQAGIDDVNKSVQELSIDEEIKIRENTFSFIYKEKKHTFAVSLESVLSGHENWIYSIRWQPPVVTETSSHQPMKLLSASMDKTMIIWMPDPESGVWIEQVRVGEVGGNTLGLYGGMFAPDGRSIIAHGYQGAFHQWSYNESSNQWRPVVTGSGHFDEVEDLGWDTGGQFVVTVSKDQTTRLHAPTIHQQGKEIWYEIARPQVHGYDLQCLTIINRYKFASGADEKVIRAFEAPRNFIENFCTLCGKDLKRELQKEEAQNRPEGASVPALGLSNKAVFGGEKISADREMQPHPNDQYPEVYFSPMTLTEPPTEEQLLQNTLWPETQKLYGHGYEIFSLASDPTGKILASSCKAAKAEFAGIILWDTTNWIQLCTLSAHTLTVTQMAFSHCGNFLLSVSRDRTWAVYNKKSHDQPESDPLFTKLLGTDKKSAVHSRIIWSCAWSPDSKNFYTASRDKKIIVWQNPGLCEDPSSALQPVDSVTLSDSVTAIDVSRNSLPDKRHLVAAGLDNGRISLYTWGQTSNTSDKWQLVTELDQGISHHLTVKRIQFCPHLKDNNIQQFASCSLDHCVKIYKIDYNKL